MNQIMVVGAGSVGGYFGAHLARKHSNVSFLLRPKTQTAVAAKGLTIRSAIGESFTVHPQSSSIPQDLPQPDLIILGVKAYDLDEVIAQLEPILKRWECCADAAQALKIWEDIEVDRDVLDAVRRVRNSGLRVGLATNQWLERAEYMSSHPTYQRVFDALFFSCEVGAAKPDRAYFERVLHELRVPADRVLFVDDSEANVQAAASLGLEAALFKRNGGSVEMFCLLQRYGIEVSRSDEVGRSDKDASA